MKFLKKLTLPRQPIMSVITFGFSGLILLAVALVLYLGVSFTTKLTRDYNQLLINTTLNNINAEVEQLLLPVENQAIWLTDQVKNGQLDIYNSNQLETFIRGALGSMANVTGAGIVFKNNRREYLLRSDNKWIRTLENDLKETEILFEEMSKVNTISWGALFWFPELNQTIIDIRAPLHVNGELVAVLLMGVTVADLSQSILQSSTDQYLTPFITYGEEHLLAHPLLTVGPTLNSDFEGPYDLNSGREQIPLPFVRGFQDTKLEEFLFSPDYITPRLIAPTQDVKLKVMSINGDIHFVATRKIFRFGEMPWTIGVYVNGEKSEQTQAIELFRMTLVGLVILILSVVASVKVARKMARPIRRLSDHAVQIRKGEIEQLEPLPRSRLRELDQAALAFNEMVDGLKERDLIREVFGRYVPESIAASLMKENGELEPVSTEATILFSDIAQFTKITEEVGPERIVTLLNEYFSRLVDILEKHGGVVTQFQGDAILATFNVPIADPDHADKALSAALEIQEMLASNLFQGIRLKTRIGINTGMVVAGAVGAKGRLNYTVHGDSVNLASRIESLNKEYGTNLLISEHSAKLITQHEMCEIGTEKIRGQKTPIKLFVIKS